MAEAAVMETGVPRADIRAGHVLSAVAGNALEFYDFTTYSFFAVQIGHALFPARNEFENLMLSLAGFGVGFISRPLGGIVIGAYGDRAGRKPAMLLAFMLMGFGILGMAFVPSYASIGMAAPALAAFFRLLQGFALGGNVGPASAYLIEAAPPERRGFYTSLQFASQGFAVAAGGLVGTILSSVLDTASLESWGWRAAFLLGAAVLPFGLYVRRTLPETFEARAVQARTNRADIRRHIGTILFGLLTLLAGTIATYTLNNMNNYASVFLHMRVNLSFAATLVLGVTVIVFSIVGGIWSDRAGRRPIMIWPRVALLVVTWPLFAMLASHRDALWLLGTTAVLSALNGLSTGPAFAALAEALPKELRSGGLSTIYAFSIAIFGGTAQLIETWLVHYSGNVLAPAWYLTVAMAIGTLAAVFMFETAPARRQERFFKGRQ